MQPFDLLKHAARAEMPERLTNIASWHRHIPFAFALLDMSQPRVFVELGTHKGDSYSAFCQGVLHQGLATRCYAVDTWQGDEQAGLYDGDNILADLKGHHDPRYSGFSSLLRMTFDEALQHFADGSVDLLHIDGLHTYEAVRHDFETWLPKMSERGVVIFHDTNVRYSDFGVWQLWGELKQRYPGFEFPYGFGLGVLAVGEQVPQPVLQFIEAANADPKAVIQLFHALGDGIELFKTQQQQSETQAHLERIGADLGDARKVVEERDKLLEEYNRQRDALLAALGEARAQSVSERHAQSERIEELSQAVMRITAAQRQTQQRLERVCGSRIWRTRNNLLRLLGKEQWVVEPTPALPGPAWPPAAVPKVDIIIPVYRGYEETRACIESVLANPLSVDAEIIVIEDASPVPELVEWLKTQTDRITLLHNERNRGFVATVNRGMLLHHDRDVILLNSDTKVTGDWLGRIQRAAYSGPNVGSVTPFSNSATICSYPNFCYDSPLPEGADVADMDAMFQRVNAGQYADIPTAVGFCMYIRRDCLNESGLFDEKLFGRGYGEENEFCMRSAERGWRHLICGDVFVYHKGGVSFAETQIEHQRAGHRALLSVYPNYDLVIRDYIQADPSAHMRFSVDVLRTRESGLPVILMVNHNRGGGTARHLRSLVEALEGKAEVYLLQPHEEGGRASLGALSGDKKTRLLFDPTHDFPLLLTTLRTLGVSRIHFHHTIGLHLQFLLLPEQLRVPYDVTIHDYYLACPQVTLTDEKGQYCGAPDAAGCNACLANRPAPGGVDIDRWREFGTRLLNGAERVFTPSVDTQSRMRRYFPDARFISVPHERDLPQIVEVRPLADERPMKVVVLGALSLFKGADLLEAVALEARRQRAPIEFHLLGYAYRHLSTYPMSNLYAHGPYQDEQIDDLLSELQPDLVWFPGSCPETYNYTLSICMRAGLPVIAPELGAFPERLAGRPWSWLVDPRIDAQGAFSLMQDVRRQLLEGAAPERIERHLPPADDYVYADDYVLEEMAPLTTPEPDWQALHAGWSKLGAAQQVIPPERYPRVLRILRRVLAHRWARGVVGRIPPGMKVRIKQVLWR